MPSEITGALMGYGLGAAFFATTIGAGNIALEPYGEHLLRPAPTKYVSHARLSNSLFARQEDYLEACTKAARKAAEGIQNERGKLKKDIASLRQQQSAGEDTVKPLQAKLADVRREIGNATEKIRFHSVVVETEHKTADASRIRALEDQIQRIRGERLALEKLAIPAH